MSLLDGFKKFTQPYDDDDEFFDEADESFKAPSLASDAQRKFESTFSSSAAAEPEPEDDEDEEDSAPAEGAGLFGSFKHAKPKMGRPASAGGEQVYVFKPRTVAECGVLANYLSNSHTVLMTMDGISSDEAQRMIDYISGVVFALQGKIYQVSDKTYYVTPPYVTICVVNPGDFSGDQGAF